VRVLNDLEVKNKELKGLVGMLDCEVGAGKCDQEYLIERLMRTEEQLVVAEGASRYHSEKVELIKNDLQMLKLQI
jgi:hypothetical protein